eukprot:2726696-Prymnesium_polylepis.1
MHEALWRSFVRTPKAKDLRRAGGGSARGPHALHMFTARVAAEPGGTKCATARKSWCAAPNFVHVHTPAVPLI